MKITKVHRQRAGLSRRYAFVAVLASAALATACAENVASSATTAPGTTSPDTTTPYDHEMKHKKGPDDRAAAMLAAAGYQDVATAEAAGYASSLNSLGCFTDPERGGMGVHYINQSLMDGQVNITKPEALVYELDATGVVTGLVAHEYIVPIEAWTESTPPKLFGMYFHQHPTLPLWVLHAWLWKNNPSGIFQDWNPAVRQCPPGVPIFGKDLPAPTSTTTTTSAPEEPQHVPGGGLVS
jgi:hypothetical protein